jgi:hypothetical protein
MRTNLPAPVSSPDSGAKTKLFFDEYGQAPLEFNANDVESTVGFFQSKGFDRDAAEITAAVILKQAKLETMPVFKILDQLKGIDGLELSALVGEILNNNRPSSSSLGFKMGNSDDLFKTRNIGA